MYIKRGSKNEEVAIYTKLSHVIGYNYLLQKRGFNVKIGLGLALVAIEGPQD